MNPLARRNILVAMQDVVRVIALFEFLKAIKRFSAERSPHAFNGLIGLHIVDISTTTKRPRLDSQCGFTRPMDLFSVKGRILPNRQRTDVKRRMAEPCRSSRRVGIFWCPMQRLNHNASRWTTQRN